MSNGEFMVHCPTDLLQPFDQLYSSLNRMNAAIDLYRTFTITSRGTSYFQSDAGEYHENLNAHFLQIMEDIKSFQDKIEEQVGKHANWGIHYNKQIKIIKWVGGGLLLIVVAALVLFLIQSLTSSPTLPTPTPTPTPI